MKQSEWIARIESATKTIRGVRGAAELAVINGELNGMVYVYPLSDAAGSNTLYGDGAFAQRVTERVALVYVARNARDGTGAASITDLEAMRDDVWTALIGWQLNTEHAPVEHRSGALLSMDGTTILWQDEFETSSLWRAL